MVSDLVQFYLRLSKGLIFFKDDFPQFFFLGQQQLQLSPALAMFHIERR